MRRIFMLVLCQAGLCALETYLVLRISLIGKIGIALVHREYRLLRSGWKTFLLFFGLQLAVIGSLYVLQQKYSQRMLQRGAWLLIALAAAGLLLTYLDFINTYSHRLLKERFHLAFYLFWFSWMGSCLFFLTNKYVRKQQQPWPTDENAPVGGMPL